MPKGLPLHVLGANQRCAVKNSTYIQYPDQKKGREVSQGQDVVASTRFANGVAALVLASEQGVIGAPTVEEARAYLVK